MTYRKLNNCGIFLQLAKFIRRTRWHKISKPLGSITLTSYPALKKHFDNSY